MEQDSVLAALQETITLPDHLDKWTDPYFGPVTVTHIHVPDEEDFFAVVVLSRPAEGTFFLCKGGALTTIQQDGEHQFTPNDIDGLWGCGRDLVVATDQTFFHATFSPTSPPTLSWTPLTTVPPNLLEGGLTATFIEGKGLCVAALVSEPKERDPMAPKIIPLTPPPCYLMRYTPESGWVRICSVPPASACLNISANGVYAVWKVMKRFGAPEEGERGDFWGAEMREGVESRRLTWLTGRVSDARVSSAGHVVYHGNHSQDRPITTHQDLWLLQWNADKAEQPIRITGGNTYIESWGWKEDGVSLWVSMLQGVHRASCTVTLNGGWKSKTPLTPAISGVVSWNAHGEGLWPTEDPTSYQRLHCTASSQPIRLPHPQECDDLVVDVLTWSAPDGQPITGVLARHVGAPASAQLILHIHGGPATAQRGDRAIAAACTRYPYRQLLAAGYVVLQPMYRGTLGYGDAFAQANITRQGLHHGDLGDILSGIEHVRSLNRCKLGPVGIFGGSYGGYMTLRCMAVAGDVFGCGVGQYGFIHNRWMSYEGGDFTFEDEYLAQGRRKFWPLTNEDTASDVFEHLHAIKGPVLLMHGQDDDICPPSQSLVAYHVIRDSGVPTGLILYPGEGHGFDRPMNRQDRDRRILVWFREYMPTDMPN